jgi:hypothetical protein
MRWLVYAHPVAMLLVIALGMAVLREGLRNRRARLARRAYDWDRHRRLARPFAWLVAIGWLSGVASMSLLRGKPLFESVHSAFATGAALCIGAAWLLGRELERGRERFRPAHAALAGLGLFLALVAAIAAFAILP